MTESDRKNAFRIAYDFMGRHQPVEFTGEYFTNALDDIRKLRANNKDNVLLEHLLIGIYEYFVRISKEEHKE